MAQDALGWGVWVYSDPCFHPGTQITQRKALPLFTLVTLSLKPLSLPMAHVDLGLGSKVALQGYFLRKEAQGNEGPYEVIPGVCGGAWWEQVRGASETTKGV